MAPIGCECEQATPVDTYEEPMLNIKMEIRTLRRNEIEKVRNITRNEVVEQVYYLIDGKLVLKDEFYDMKGWNVAELDRSIARLHDICDRNGVLLGAFLENRLIGVSALEPEFIGGE